MVLLFYFKILNIYLHLAYLQGTISISLEFVSDFGIRIVNFSVVEDSYPAG
jgi:hypothetical protein